MKTGTHDRRKIQQETNGPKEKGIVWATALYQLCQYIQLPYFIDFIMSRSQIGQVRVVVPHFHIRQTHQFSHPTIHHWPHHGATCCDWAWQ